MKNTSSKKPHTHMTLRDVQAAESKTDWQRLKDAPDTAVTLAAEEDADNLPLDEAFFEAARRMQSSKSTEETQEITLCIDADVQEWFRATGSGYQSRMNAVLKAYVQTHEGHGQL
ncbi:MULTISPECIES: BrnA antitoxin family protein [unclassified Desulfovibrio]|uniref:BrnA antitoxin family protein n=1 Tax=unclassified Desulfovibrio TaxID=2593640 RepID=UPI002FD97FF9